MTPIPPYVAALREHIGADLIWLPGVTAIILRDTPAGTEVLLQHRSDTDEWNPICGSIDPGENPDTCAVREAREEAGIDIAVDAVLSIGALNRRVLPNGHQMQYYDTALLCHPVGSGDDAHVADEESRSIVWVPVADLPEMEERFVWNIGRAAAGDVTPVIGLPGHVRSDLGARS